MKRDWGPGPLRPQLSVEEVHVWRADLSDGDRADPTALSTEERERAARMRRAGDGARWTVARWALRAVLGRYLGQKPGDVALGVRAGGKPKLDDPRPRLRFNLSHSGDLALIAVARDLEVGVDVERIDPHRDFLVLARHGLDREAAAAVNRAPPLSRPQAFHEAWTRKEAVAKCFGTGLAAPPPPDPVSVYALHARAGYVAALAVTVAPREIGCLELTGAA